MTRIASTATVKRITTTRRIGPDRRSKPMIGQRPGLTSIEDLAYIVVSLDSEADRGVQRRIGRVDPHPTDDRGRQGQQDERRQQSGEQGDGCVTRWRRPARLRKHLANPPVRGVRLRLGTEPPEFCRVRTRARRSDSRVCTGADRRDGASPSSAQLARVSFGGRRALPAPGGDPRPPVRARASRRSLARVPRRS
jgi:hypothetical protein